jgi:uncharacterized protein (DUF1778 family)
MGLKKTYTQKAMEKTILFHAPEPLVELLRCAASQQEVSRSHFIRQAIKEKASRVLSGIDNYLSSEAGSMVILAASKESKE